MRTLFIVQVPPYPVSGGVSLRNWQNLNLLRQWGEVGIFSLYKGEPQKHAALSKFSLWHHVNLSTPKRTLWEKIRRRFWWLRPGGHARVDWLYSQSTAGVLREILQKFQPTLIIVEEIWLFGYLPLLKEWGCPVILDNHNVEGDRARYLASSIMTVLKLQKIRYIERQFIQQTDQVWMCSQQDIHVLDHLYPGLNKSAQTYLVPNGVNSEDYADLRSHQLLPPSAFRMPAPTIIYLGRFSYEPNAEAAEILLTEIFPAVKAAMADSRLLLVGCAPTPTIKRLARQQADVTVTGQVDDVKPFLAAATMMVVPLQRGSGTRLKLLEAFAAKCPVISTAKGAEGLTVEDGKQLLLRETPDAMVQAIQYLSQYPQQSQDMAVMAYQLFQTHYGWPAVSQQIQKALNHLPA